MKQCWVRLNQIHCSVVRALEDLSRSLHNPKPGDVSDDNSHLVKLVLKRSSSLDALISLTGCILTVWITQESLCQDKVDPPNSHIFI